MLHLIWYIIVGFLAGCVAKALMHTHLSITWTVVLGIVGSIIGGAVTHLFYPPSAGGRFHPGSLIVSHSRSDFSPLSLAQVSDCKYLAGKARPKNPRATHTAAKATG
jgi:uncharacterized membrane protein YeaQ/YmgE (transglycosylase-associated protein family)